MATGDEIFRTAKFGGYDKDDVEQGIQRIQDAAAMEKNDLKGKLEQANRQLEDKDAEITSLNAKIHELQDSLIAKDKELQDVEKNVREKYQSYVDNYDTIGSLIYEAKLRAKQIDRDTEAQKQRILAEAQTEAQQIRDNAAAEGEKMLEDVEKQIDEKNRNGKMQYEAVQEELAHVVEIFNQVQKQFMNSYREIQNIISDVNGPQDISE
jgi:chromosome segregation ATPase